MKHSLHRLWKENAGGSLVEYALLGAMIAIGVAASIGELTHSLRNSFSHAAAGMAAGPKSGLTAGGGLLMLPDDPKWIAPASPAPSTGSTELAKLAASLEGNGALDGTGTRLRRLETAAEKIASQASQYAKSWSSLPLKGGITGAQGAIVAGWTAAVPR